MILEIPVWFPEVRPKDPSVAAFWIAFGKDGVVQLSAESRTILEQAVGMRVYLGEQPLPVEEFFVLTQRERVRRTGRERLGWLREDGFGCVVFRFHLKDDSLLTQKPLAISYRQPHYEAGGAGRFYYLPIFNGLPEGEFTSNTNQYSFTIAAEPECALTLSSGEVITTIQPGQSIAVSPRHHQAIRARVTRQPKSLHATAAAPGS